MVVLFRTTLVAALILVALLAGKTGVRAAEDKERSPCTEDAMLVFDASGSMAGNLNQGISTIIPRIDEVRSALAEVLPAITRVRRVGLITYGPGPYQQCNVELAFKPTPDAALIMQEVKALNPAGKTPLAAAAERAAEVLDYQAKPG
jgi:Ca-activated chloride channel family protein